MPEWFSMTPEQRINEAGTMPPCPFCKFSRVQRSDYVRCNRCGINWLDGEDLTKNPKVERFDNMVTSMKGIVSSRTEKQGGALPAELK